MNEHGMNTRNAAQVRDALVRYVEQPEAKRRVMRAPAGIGGAALSGIRWRTVISTLAVLAIIVPISAVLITGSLRTTKPVAPGGVSSAECAADAVTPFDCRAYSTVSATTAGVVQDWLPSLPFDGWFETRDGHLTFVLNAQLGQIRVHVTPNASGGTSAALTGDYGFAQDCDPGSACYENKWLINLLTSEAAFTVSGTALTITSGEDSLVLQRTSAVHHYTTVGVLRSNGRILLTYAPQSTGTGGVAVEPGKIGTNSYGCITLGDHVLVLREGATLDNDGSIVIAGRRYEQGEDSSPGGSGVGEAPSNSPCGPAATYFFV